MKPIKILTLTVLLGMLASTASFAQDQKPTDPAPKPDPTTKPADPTVKPVKDGTAAPAKPELPQAVKDAIQKFQLEREQFLADQKKLLESLKTATDDARAKIREELKANRHDFAAKEKQFREEVREQLKQVRDTLKDHAKPVDAAGGNGRPGSK